MVRALRAVFGWKPGSIRADLKDVLDADTGETGFSPEESTMLKNILGLRERRVEDVMLPRADIFAVQHDIVLGELMKVFANAGHSRLVVYDETLDDAVGMVHIRDLIAFMIDRAAASAKANTRRKKPFPADLDLKAFRKRIQLHVEALNHATKNIPPAQLRLHLCWGNYEGPHHYDVPLADIIDVVFSARADAISLEAANPRHAHEYTVFETVKLPPGKVLIPGVIESKSNFIEHPDLIAQRIGRYAGLVGRENVIAGSDCGYGTWVGQAAVDPDVVWAKMAAMAEGARIATKQFWN